MNAFIKGKQFEYRVQRFLRDRGWFVVRQPRSAFPDLIAIKRDGLMLIECRMRGNISTTERRTLTRIACEELGGHAMLAMTEGELISFREYRPYSRKPKEVLNLD